ncbi:MAG: PAS domain-containing protein [Kiloniellales bacterium]|nr:PAS domain-containing protein [Kiloniellales bacterium]
MPVDVGEAVYVSRAIGASEAHESCRELLDLWHRRCAGRPVPAPSDFPPEDLVAFLGRLCLFDVREEPLRFTLRLDGSEISERSGQDLTGRDILDLEPQPYARMVFDALSEALTTGRPVIHQCVAQIQSRWYYQRVTLPLSTDGINIDRMMTYAYVEGTSSDVLAAAKRGDETARARLIPEDRWALEHGGTLA